MDKIRELGNLRRTILSIATLGLLASFAAGCSSLPAVEDIVDLDFDSDSAPDEREVRVHQVLVMPPDYNLRAPADGSVPIEQDGQANPYALPTMQESAALLAADAENSAASTDAVTSSTLVANADPDAEGPQSLSTDGQQATAAQTTQADQWPFGINPNHPDGTPKTSNELNEERRLAREAAERAENPRYGTIFNIGSIFSD